MSEPGARTTLAAIQETLADFAPPFAPERAAQLQRRTGALGQAFAHLDDLVVIGLAGGTGVGKSTMINALAGREIAAASARRPTSERIVVFQHKDAAFASRLPPEVLSIEETRHTSEELRRIVILDLPDADSVRTDHRRILDLVLPHADLVLFVADPSKYGDRIFHELIAHAAQARENKIVVFNKTDEIAASYGARAEEVLADILEDLARKLAGAGSGAPAPRILPLSAKEAFEAKRAGRASPAAFAALEAVIGDLREEKLRRQIKLRNLDAGYDALKAELRAELARTEAAEKVAAFQTEVSDAERELEAQGMAMVASTFTPALFRRLSRYLVGRSSRAWAFPARLVVRLLRMTLTRPLPQGSLVEERLGMVRQRRERALGRLRRMFERTWGAPFPEPVEPARIAPDIRQRLEAVAAEARPRRFVGAVIAGILAVAFFMIRPALVRAMGGAGEVSSAGGVVRGVLQALLEALHPFHLVLWILLFCAVYSAIVLIAALRLHAESEKKLNGLVDGLRQELDRATRLGFEPLRRRAALIEERIRRLRELVG